MVCALSKAAQLGMWMSAPDRPQGRDIVMVTAELAE